jgi:hypothetical protein
MREGLNNPSRIELLRPSFKKHMLTYAEFTIFGGIYTFNAELMLFGKCIACRYQAYTIHELHLSRLYRKIAAKSRQNRSIGYL